MDSDFIVELFAPFGRVTVRRMFGGAGLFREGLMFGLVFDGAIFLKVDEASIPDFEREGSATLRLHAGEERRPRRPPFALLLAPAGAALRRSRGAGVVGEAGIRYRRARQGGAAQARGARCEAEGEGAGR